MRLEELVREIETAVIAAANAEGCKLTSVEEYYEEYSRKTEYIKRFIFNVVNRKYTEKIADRIAEAVQNVIEEISNKLDLYYDFGGDDFALYDVLLEYCYDNTKEVEVAIYPDFWRAEIEVALYVKHYMPQIIFAEKLDP